MPSPAIDDYLKTIYHHTEWQADRITPSQLAGERGLDPDKWFNNVEIVASERLGTETTTYVRNIYKYYVAYRLTKDAQQRSMVRVRQSEDKTTGR